MKTIISSILAVFAVCNLYAADPLYTLNDFDDGSTGSWTSSAPAKLSISNSGGTLDARLASQTVPTFVEETLFMPLAPGSYVTNISFTLAAVDRRPSRLRLQFRSAVNGHIWHLQLPIPDVGQSLAVNSAMNYGEGWSMGAPADATQFSNDVRSVDWVGIRIRRNADIAAQNYAIDNFFARGLFFIKDSDGDGMADDWEATHGLSSNDVNDAAIDSDGDGVCNYAEYRGGSNPRNATSYFIATVRRGPDKGHAFQLRWPAIANRTYSVWRARDLSEGFVKIASGIHATPPENVFEESPSESGPLFYRIQVDPEITP